MAVIPPVFIDCVVAVGGIDENGNRIWTGSGFFFGRPAGDGQHVFVVTNRHVAEGLRGGVLRLNPRGTDPARELTLSEINPTSQEWFYHPRPEVDVAVMPVGVALDSMGLQLHFFVREPHIADVARMNSLGVREGDPIYALGFPLGLIGRHRSAVVARIGCVAQIQEALARSSDTYLIDAGIFPGNSGGPVILKPEIVFVPDTKAQNRSYLIGIVVGFVPYQEVAISAQTKRARIVFEENSGLAAVHPVDMIEEAIDSFYQIVAQRAQNRTTPPAPPATPVT